MALIEIEKSDEIAILRLNNGITNNINLKFVTEILRNINELKDESSIRGIVFVSGNDKFFSIGFDLPRLYKQSIDEVKTFYQNFNKLCLELYTFPKPTIAAITGHAIAGGCILALCCDYRIIAEGRKLMGLNEIKLGLPVPYPADRILHQIVGNRIAREIIFTGEFYPSEKLLKIGIVDEMLPIEQVLPKAIRKAKLIGAMPTVAFNNIKQNHVEFVKKKIETKLAEDEKNFLDCWQSDEVQELIKDAIKKF